MRVDAGYFEARESIEHRIPASVAADVRDRLFRMTEQISGTVRL
ncbi:MAG TPA: hypothetical protein VL200_12100 [Lacunisphaera sp.]|nr:hypothetical protein [Sphingomicrobium sp.]HTL68397.1 hypothetical protein [Lacunisphaera sp.]